MVDIQDFRLVVLNENELNTAKRYSQELTKIEGKSAFRTNPQERSALKPLDTYVGVLGELAYYRVFFGEEIGFFEYARKVERQLESYKRTKSPSDGGTDIEGTEIDIKSSKYINKYGSWQGILYQHLLVTKWSYRNSKIYSQAFVEFGNSDDLSRVEGTGRVILSGWAMGSELYELASFHNSLGLPVRDTHPVRTLPLAI